MRSSRYKFCSSTPEPIFPTSMKFNSAIKICFLTYSLCWFSCRQNNKSRQPSSRRPVTLRPPFWSPTLWLWREMVWWSYENWRQQRTLPSSSAAHEMSPTCLLVRARCCSFLSNKHTHAYQLVMPFVQLFSSTGIPHQWDGSQLCVCMFGKCKMFGLVS